MAGDELNLSAEAVFTGCGVLARSGGGANARDDDDDSRLAETEWEFGYSVRCISRPAVTTGTFSCGRSTPSGATGCGSEGIQDQPRRCRLCRHGSTAVVVSPIFRLPVSGSKAG
jgi:hypothetical protein